MWVRILSSVHLSRKKIWVHLHRMSSLAHLFLRRGSFRPISRWKGNSTVCRHLPIYSYVLRHLDRYSLKRQFNNMSSLAHLFICLASFRPILVEETIQQYVVTCPPIPMSWVIQTHTRWRGNSTVCRHLPTYLGHSDPYWLKRQFNSTSQFFCHGSIIMTHIIFGGKCTHSPS